QVPKGSYVGRWYVKRHASPAELTNWPSPQARVVVECVCGRERPILLRYLVLGRSTGCRSKRCRNAWEAAGRIVEWAPHLDRRDVARGLRELERSPAAILRDLVEDATRPAAAMVRQVLQRYGVLQLQRGDSEPPVSG
ncbi:MAG: hypothetical protein ACOCUS_05215, partial [Polyangiales bacterium]